MRRHTSLVGLGKHRGARSDPLGRSHDLLEANFVGSEVLMEGEIGRGEFGRLVTVKSYLQETPGARNSALPFSRVVLRNSIEAEIFQLDYEAQPVSWAILLGVLGENCYLLVSPKLRHLS